jgi:hypothetical protein
MNVVKLIKTNLAKFVPSALKKRYGHSKRRGHARKHRR